MAKRSIPDIVIGRLPVYLRDGSTFSSLKDDRSRPRRSSGDRLGISSAQIRKDLSHFGEFGKQGTGYDITFLHRQLSEILKVDRMWNVALVGVGNLGKAVADYPGFAGKGFNITVIFDNEPAKIGQVMGVNKIKVQPVEESGSDDSRAWNRRRHHRHARGIRPDDRSTIIDAGVKAILNYAPITIMVPAGVRVQYIDPVVGLQRMTYYLP